MTNKTNIILIGISLIVILIGLIMTYLNPSEDLGSTISFIGLVMGHYLGLILLLRNGTIIETIFFKIIKFFIGLSCIACIFKIMHWTGADLLLIVSLVGIALTYTVWFVVKKQKRTLDILKLLWVLTSYFSSALLILHLIPIEITYISIGLLWICLIVFIVTSLKTNTMFDK